MGSSRCGAASSDARALSTSGGASRGPSPASNHRCWPSACGMTRISEKRIDPSKPKRRIGCKVRSEEHTSELQSLMRISYAVFCLKKQKKNNTQRRDNSKTQKKNHRSITKITSKNKKYT